MTYQIFLGKSIKLPKKDNIHKFIIILIFIYGFLIATFYSSYLGSILVFSEDNNDYEIICEPITHGMFLEANPESKKSVKWRIFDFFNYNLGIETMESSKYGYCLMSNVWQVYKTFQNTLIERRFKVYKSWKTPSLYPANFYIRKSFKNLYSTFFINAYSGGLIDKWYQDFYLTSWIHQLFQEVFEKNSFRQNIKDMELAFKVLIIGYILSFVVIIFEFLSKKR